MPHIQDELVALVDHLASATPQAQWCDWHIQRIAGGQNGIVYHVTCHAIHHALCAGADLTIKFTARDARNRAGREYQAMGLLERLGLHLAPTAVWLNMDRYPQPVIVQT